MEEASRPLIQRQNRRSWLLRLCSMCFKRNNDPDETVPLPSQLRNISATTELSINHNYIILNYFSQKVYMLGID